MFAPPGRPSRARLSKLRASVFGDVATLSFLYQLAKWKSFPKEQTAERASLSLSREEGERFSLKTRFPTTWTLGHPVSYGSRGFN